MIEYLNNVQGTVTSGGTSAPSSGSTDTWTVTTTTFPASLAGDHYFHVVDPVLQTEKIKVTTITGSSPYTWSVIRGDESTTPVAHATNFIVQQVATAGDLLQDEFGMYNVRAFGAAGDGSTDDTTAFQNTLNAISNSTYGGTMVVPPGNYVVSNTLNYTSTTNSLYIYGGGAHENGNGLTDYVTAISSSHVGNLFNIQGSPYAEIQDLALLSTGTNSSGTGIEFSAIYMSTVASAKIRRCQLQGGPGGSKWNTGIHMIGSVNGCLIEEIYSNSASQCIWFDGGAGMTIKDSFGGPDAGSGFGFVRMDNTSNSTGGPATLNMYNVVTEQGDYGFISQDVNSSEPIFIYMNNIQVNRPHVNGLYFGAGSQVWLDYVWVSSSGLTGVSHNTAITCTGSFQGWFYMENSVIQGFYDHGLVINGGQGFVISNTSFGGCGHAATNTYFDLTIGTASNITISACHFDVDKFNTLSSPAAKAAINIQTTASNVLINSCQFTTGTSYSGGSSLVDPGGVATLGTNLKP